MCPTNMNFLRQENADNKLMRQYSGVSWNENQQPRM